MDSSEEVKASSSFSGSITVTYPKNEIIEVLHYNKLVAVIKTDWSRKIAHVKQFSKDKLVIPFPSKGESFEVPMQEFVDYLQSRCFPPTRDGASLILKGMGLNHYNPLKIVKKTHGILHEDYVWLRFEGEEGMRYEDCGIREVPGEWLRDGEGIY